MSHVTKLLLAALAGVLAAAPPALAQTTLTMSSWVSPQHHLTAVVLQGWANEVEKVTHGRMKFQSSDSAMPAPGSSGAAPSASVQVSAVVACGR